MFFQPTDSNQIIWVGKRKTKRYAIHASCTQLVFPLLEGIFRGEQHPREADEDLGPENSQHEGLKYESS